MTIASWVALWIATYFFVGVVIAALCHAYEVGFDVPRDDREESRFVITVWPICLIIWTLIGVGLVIQLLSRVAVVLGDAIVFGIGAARRRRRTIDGETSDPRW